MSSGSYSDSSEDESHEKVEKRTKESKERKGNDGIMEKNRSRSKRSSLKSDDRSRSRSPEKIKTTKRSLERPADKSRSPSSEKMKTTKRSLERDDRSRSLSPEKNKTKRSRSREKRSRSSSESRGRDFDRSRESRSRSRSGDRTRRRSRSRSKSREHQYRHGRRYWDDDRYSDRRSPERRRRRSREDRSRGNSDIYWNKYGDRRSDLSKGGRKENEEEDSSRRKERRDPENRDPNVGTRTRGGDIDEKGDKLQEPSAKRARKAVDEGAEALTLRTGGAYIPPARLRMMQAELTDKSSIAYQRFAWEALKKSINGLINKVNVANMDIICRELMKENVVRGRGLLARAIMQAQAASPTFTHVYAALVCILNSKFPQFGELVLTRLIIQFRRGFRRNDKNICLSATKFVAHLANQEVAHEVVALEILTLLLENATDDSVEVAVGFLKECGAKLTEVSPRGIHAIFERLRSILHEGLLDKRVQYMIEVVFAVRKDGFKDHPVISDGLDKVDEADRITHLISLDEATDGQDMLNVFKHEPAYEENEEKYKSIRNEILDEDSSDDSEAGTGDDDETDSEEDEDGEGEGKDQTIIDSTETNLAAFRRVVYLTIHSSLDYEECVHKLLKMEQKPGQEVEVCHMILDCCAQQRSYEKFYGLLAQRFCQLSRSYVEPFECIFRDTYDTIHRLEVNKMRNVAKVFAHLLFTDAISWGVLGHIKLNEDDTTSSSRIVIKVIFQELAEYMGLPKLNERVKDPTLQEAFAGLFPRDNPVNTRFAINFFTSIGLGGLTDELREHLKSMPKVSAVRPPPPESVASSAPSANSSSEEEDEESSSSSSSSSLEDEKKRRKKEKSKSSSSKTPKSKSVNPRKKETKHSSSTRRKTVSKTSSSDDDDSSSDGSDDGGKEDQRRMVERKRVQEDLGERETYRRNEDVRDRDCTNEDVWGGKKRDSRKENFQERDRKSRNNDVRERERVHRKEDLRERDHRNDDVRWREREHRNEDIREREGERRSDVREREGDRRNDVREREGDRRNDVREREGERKNDVRERERRNEDARERDRNHRDEGSSRGRHSDRK